MLESDFEHDLNEFLDGTDDLDTVHFVLPGAVVSGQLIRFIAGEKTKTVRLQNACVIAGGSPTTSELLFVPYERILAWGEGSIEPAT